MESELNRLFHTTTPLLLYTLLDGPLGGIELEYEAGRDQSFVQKNMKMNQEKGLVERNADKKWMLTPYGAEVAAIMKECDRKLSKMKRGLE